MFEVIKKSDNRVDIAVSGQIDADEMRKSLSVLLSQSEGIENGVMLYRLTDFKMPSMGALGVEFAMIPKLFGLLGRFDKCAVLCDQAWIRNAAEIEGKFLPGLHIKSFAVDNEAGAEAWLAQS